MEPRANAAHPALPGSASDDAPALLVLEALDDEYWELREPGRPRPANPLRDRYVETYWQCDKDPDNPEKQARFAEARAAFLKELTGRLHAAKRSAICFSGGGIRSATFGLGVLQALARQSADGPERARPALLGEFDYLSTVSGGGYLGSWFSAWAARLSEPPAASPTTQAVPGATTSRPAAAAATAPAPRPDGTAAVIRQLATDTTTSGFDPGSPALRYLRDYSNYLTPQLGLFSGDTWGAVGSVVRNMVLNWLVLIPLAAAALLLPLAASKVAGVYDPPALAQWVLLITALGSGLLATAYIGFDLPSAGDARKGYVAHLWLCLVPLTVSAVQYNVLWAWLGTGDPAAAWWNIVALGQSGLTGLQFALLGGVMHGGGMLLGIAIAMVKFNRPTPVKGLYATAAALLTGAFAGYVASRFTTLAMHPGTPVADPRFYTVLAFPLVVGVFLLAGVLLTGLTSYITDDKDREWWARSGGTLLALALAWPLFATVSLYAVGTLALLGMKAKMAFAGLTGATGWGASQLGGSPQTASGRSQSVNPLSGLLGQSRVKEIASRLLLPLFLVLLGMLLALLNETLVTHFTVVTRALGYFLGDRAAIDAAVAARPWLFSFVPAIRETGDVWLFVGAWVLLGIVASVFINVNKFSLHGMYRQRLIRGYLGASNARRDPNPFTGFDENDNLPMCTLTTQKPMHVVNMTLNLVHGSKLAWQQRKAEPFSSTRLHTGSCRLLYRTSAIYGGRYKDTLGKLPITLGTAMTISGAAASPNMGYNSSPLMALVMTLFNARLGWWLGNPKDASNAWKRPGPRYGIRPFIDEAFGLTDDRNKWVYLSDGGHFENLAIYEMVLRRCAVIVVSDAGADPLFAYEDLGNAVRKIRIDLGISIEFPEQLMPEPYTRAAAARAVAAMAGAESVGAARNAAAGADAMSAGTNAAARPGHCVVGRIRYGAIDAGADDGVIVYLKPSLTGDEPSDVLHYATTDVNFPHQTTVDQFFDEPQFESYRRLGAHVIESILNSIPEGDTQADAQGRQATQAAGIDLAEFLKRARAYAGVAS
jgi:hypothetical protein